MATKTVEDYETTIRELHSKKHALPDYHPEYQKLDEQIGRQVNKWADLADICVFAANNEQTPITEKELGLPIRPMLKKKETSFNQTGDYHFTVNGKLASLVMERKGTTRQNGFMKSCDLYSSLFNRDNRDRFRNELSRFKCDERFDIFIVICECSYGEFLSFTPLFNGRTRNTNHIGASKASRVGTLCSLELDGCHVIFAGTRMMAIELYRSLIRQWCIKNYERILRL